MKDNTIIKDTHNLLPIVANSDNLIEGFKRIRIASAWKAATQQMRINLLKNINELRTQILLGEYKQRKPNQFIMNESHRLRLIQALPPSDMIVQHSLCDYVLFPSLMPFIIYDSGASIKGKGISFTRKRFEKHLRQFYKEYGRDGYIVFFDFSKFFDNIDHNILLEEMSKKIYDEAIISLIHYIISAYNIDVSFEDKTDEELLNDIHNALEYYYKYAQQQLPGNRVLQKSLGIGAPVSQISGIFLPHSIDTAFKYVYGYKYYAAYMDDRYVIVHTKEEAQLAIERFQELANKLKLHLNIRKTRIVKLTREFTFLKTKYQITETGKIIKHISKIVIVTQRRKMKALANKVKNKELSYIQFINQYMSWRGEKKEYNSFKSIRQLDILFNKLKNDLQVYEKRQLKKLYMKATKNKPRAIMKHYCRWLGETEIYDFASNKFIKKHHHNYTYHLERFITNLISQS